MPPRSRAAATKSVPHICRLFLLAMLLASMAGCHSSGGTTPSSQPAAQSQADSIATVQNNPNIPPQTKAAIIAQIQGQTKPATSSGAPHP